MTRHAEITEACNKLKSLAENSDGDPAFKAWTKVITKLCDTIIIASPTCPPSCGTGD